MRPQRKRFIVRLSVFLLLGALVNVAVAWGCACYSPAENESERNSAIWPYFIPDEWPAAPDSGWQFAGWGLTAEIADGHGPEADGDWEGEDFVGKWNGDLYGFDWFIAGWPAGSMNWSMYDMLPDARGTLDFFPDKTHGSRISGFDPFDV